MSLILEALRKSEAERQRAGAPRLHSPTLAAPPARRSALGPVLVTAVAVALLGGTWWVGREVERPAPVLPSPTLPVVGQPTPTALPVVAPHRVVAPPPRVLPPPPPADPVGRPRELPTPAPASRAPIPLPAPAGPSRDPEPRPIPFDDQSPTDAPAPDEAPLPGLAVLSAEERATLPPLKLSMHVWSADPARRFAIVDGQRVTEGALLGGGTVAEIRPDGVVVALGDRRLLLPRP